MSNESNHNRIDDAMNISRRKAVKTIAGGIGAVAAYHTLPVTWTKPMIEQVFLPAHGQTSGFVPEPPVDPVIPESPINPELPPGPVDPPVITEPPNTFDGQYAGSITLVDTTGDGTVTTEVSVVAVYSAPNVLVTIDMWSGCIFSGFGTVTNVIPLSNTLDVSSFRCFSSGLFSKVGVTDSTAQVSISIGTFSGSGTLIKLS